MSGNDLRRAATYRDLDEDRIILTLERLWRRICERFPESGLSKVAEELLIIARESRARIDRIRRPRWGIRALAAIAIAGLGTAAVAVARALATMSSRVESSLTDMIQGGAAAVNIIILMAGAAFFLWNLEVHVKRRSALRSLHELRSIAHVVDMHQLTKDPEHVLSPQARMTASSPERVLTRFQLSRYLDYCAELLALTSKLAALHAQYLSDPVVLAAVNDVESLAGALSLKIWQKTMILDSIAVRVQAPEPV